MKLDFKNLKLKNFGFNNYRSISEEMISIENVKKINLFIGKNNSGKSNFLKFITLVSSEQNQQKIEDEHNRNGESATISFKFTFKEINFPTVIQFQDKFDNYALKSKPTEYFLADPLTFNYDLKNKSLSIDGFENLHDSALLSICHHYQYEPPTHFFLRSTLTMLKEDILVNGILTHFHDVIYIPDFRFIKEGVSLGEKNIAAINGSNIISEMFKMQNPNIGEEEKKRQFNEIISTVKMLLDIDELNIEIPYTKDKIIIDLNGTRLPLEYFGTGIHELVIICSALIIHNNHLVCLEEPEIHLHPELQKKFFNFLLTTNNQYFITTHSSSFLDFFNDQVSIYHVKYDGKKSSISLSNTNKLSSLLLSDLGYKTSDLLQSNGIIWVEGPSDRTYLNKWLSLYQTNFIEGIHYSIMFYGGKLLSHLNLDIEYLEKELIALCKINRNAFIIMDSDITASKKVLNQTKIRIQTEIGDNYWITKGKEIENYISNSTLTNWLANKHERRLQNISLDLKEDLSKLLENLQTTINYKSAKAKFSKEIINFVEKEDLKTHDLNRQINKILKCISAWNS